MSTTFLGDDLHLIGDYCISLFSVESRSAESLGDYVRRTRLSKGFSTTDVERNSRSGGVKGISDAYVTRIENGYVTNVSPAKLRALAKGLQVSEDEIFAVARGKPLAYEDPLDELKDLFHGWDEATEEERAATLDDLKMIAERFQRRLRERLKESTAIKEKPKIARVASPLHPPGWETRPGAGRDGEKPIFSAGKQGKKSQQSKKSRQA